MEENVTQVDRSGWPLNDGGFQKSRKCGEEILRNKVDKDTKEGIKAC